MQKAITTLILFRTFVIEFISLRQFNIEVQFVKSVNYTFEQSL